VAISPFEHSELGVFHTFFHFSTLAAPARASLNTAVPITALEYLEQRTRFGIKLGLGAMRRLLAELGHPQRAFAVLLVAGTNGKGSVVAYVDAALRAAGLRVGRYTSPHLVRVHERIAVDGRLIPGAALERAVGRVRRAAGALVRRGMLGDHPTHFEALTLAALWHFARRRVDVAVLEVGLGARLDATNATDPIASAIVTVARDHEAHLGGTLAAIAGEKAGVMRRGRATVAGPLPAAASAVLTRHARRLGARLHETPREVRMRERGHTVDVATRAGRYPGLRPLPGRHQRANLAVALRLLEEAHAAGLDFDLARAARGLSRARWPGRLQWLRGRPEMLLDGAHNPAAARALAAYLDTLKRPVVLLFGAMRDKRIAAMAAALFPRAVGVVLTSVGGERAARPDEIARRAGRHARALRQAPGVEEALPLARRLTPRGGVLVVAGSLYLVGDVLRLRARRAGGSSRRAASTAERSGRKPKS
jgi:dihydrofolate synthase / folylpolyglutamate synthase